MKITVESTDQMFVAEEIPVRAWKGTTDEGHEVIALVAGVTIAGDGVPDGLTPTPAPAAGRSPVYKMLLEELWHAVQRLDDDEMLELAAFANARAAYRNPACEERKCDRCGRLYRGGAVYCRLRCALEDA